MTHCYGLNRKTRQKFRKGFRQHGAIHISRNLTTFRIGDYVDIKVDGAIHKGRPCKFYHGRTGRVFNINPRAIGVIVNKQVRQRIIEKKLHIRPEHLFLSNSRGKFVERIRENDRKRTEANKANNKTVIKRLPEPPKQAFLLPSPDVHTLNPKIFFEIV